MTIKPQKLHFDYVNGRGSSGKDFQAANMMEGKPNIVKFSSGDVIREARKPGTKEHERYYGQLGPYLDGSEKGKLIPDEVIIPIMADVIKGALTGRDIPEDQPKPAIDTVIVTGFPRTVAQLAAVDAGQLIPEGYDPRNVDNQFFCLAVTPFTSRERARIRRDDPTQEKRKDDEPETVERRLKEYLEETRPMLRQLAREERLILVRSGGGKDEVTERTRRAFEVASLPVQERPKKRYL